MQLHKLYQKIEWLLKVQKFYDSVESGQTSSVEELEHI